jgi:hypothetical protein
MLPKYIHEEKHSPIWKISKDSLENIVKNCSTVSCVLLHFGLLNKGGNYKTLKSRLEALTI